MSTENDHEPDHDQRLAALVSEVADRFQKGEAVSLDDVCAQHPDLSQEIREIWGMIAVTEAVGKRKSDKPDESLDDYAPIMDLPYRFGDYQLEKEIGRGGMGVVYRARQLSLGRPVALKMILKGDQASESDRRRFQAEAEAAARLTHPNIVAINEVGQHKGRSYISMRLITGDDLAKQLAGRPMNPREAAKLMIDVALAIHYAHSQGILHRDLKPSNILLGKSGMPYVADFGLAKREQDATKLTGSGELLGTPAYMSPEQASGRGRVAGGQVGIPSDIYSLGAILYHMITGRPPFQSASPVDTILMVTEQEPVAPRILNRRVDRDLEMIVMRCLQKPQDLRYQSAEELANDLQSYLNDEPIAARQGRIGQVIVSWFRETHHANVLENWGLLWMWHSLVLLLACVATNVLDWVIVDRHVFWPYLLLWIAGFGTWAIVFWWLRRRMGPVTFVERQIAHVWAATLMCVILMFPMENLMGLEPLSLSPMLPLLAGVAFLIKAGILSGIFYFATAAMIGTFFLMLSPWFDRFDHILFGITCAACFFFIGLKYYRRSQHSS